jgi:hypothetical protein
MDQDINETYRALTKLIGDPGAFKMMDEGDLSD